MDNRREIFAEVYVRNLVRDIELALNGENHYISIEQLRWSIDVSNRNFSVVKNTEFIAEAGKKFKEFLRSIDYEPGD
jgi:tRNA U55 pseudouridine synthase TruB